MNRDEHFMRLALLQAEEARRKGEVPVGAVLVQQDNVISSAHNSPISLCDPTAHAEILALRAAGKVLGNYRLLETTLYVTLEPCLMCVGALTHARIARLVYAASDVREGVIGKFQHRFLISSGILQEESVRLLQEFFRERR